MKLCPHNNSNSLQDQPLWASIRDITELKNLVWQLGIKKRYASKAVGILLSLFFDGMIPLNLVIHSMLGMLI